MEGLRKNMTKEERCKLGAGCTIEIENFYFLHRLLRETYASDRRIREAVNLITDGGTCIHPLPYEEYLYNRENSMRDLQRFLGLNREDHKPSRYKATTDNMCEVVKNWDELCANFYGCIAWRPLLDDPRNNCGCPSYVSGHTRYCSTETETEMRENS